MFKKFLDVYKIPLAVSITLAIVLIALKVERNSLTFTLMVLGTLLGTFVLDLDYLVYAYFLEPSAEFSINFRTFLAHKDFLNALSYIQYHQNDLKDKVLNSALFQGVLGGAAIFITYSGTNFFLKALIISTFANSIYRLAELTLEGKQEDWFWALKSKPDKPAVYIYELVLIGILVYCLIIF